MRDSQPILDYARPVRPQSPWTQPEVWLAVLTNAALAVLAVGDRLHFWANREGVAVGLFIVAFALILTVTAIAGFGVLTAYLDGPTTRTRQRMAWWVFAIVVFNGVTFGSAVGWAVSRL